MRAKRDRLEQALQGTLAPDQHFLLQELLGQIASLDEAIERESREIAERLQPFEALLGLLDTVVGINRRIAEVLLAEIGTDVTRFPECAASRLLGWHVSRQS